MIDAKELRIGNLVTTTFSDAVIEIKYISKQRVKDGDYLSAGESAEKSYMPEHLSGINLTEEWLLNMGFKKIADSWYLNPVETEDEKGNDAVGSDFSLVGDSGYYLCEGFPFNQQAIKFVHQLQNLFFALTQQELPLTSVNSDKK